jgi:hypothetical protein
VERGAMVEEVVMLVVMVEERVMVEGRVMEVELE